MLDTLRLLGFAYLATLSVATIVAGARRSLLWPMLAVWTGTAAAVTFLTPWEPMARRSWLISSWMPAEAFSLVVTCATFLAIIARETRHPDAIRRANLRMALFCIPVAFAGIIYTLDPHDTKFGVFLAIRSRFWQAAFLAFVILWGNTWDGKRLSRDGLLCLYVAILNGIAGSFRNPAIVQPCFLAGMTLALGWWAVWPASRRISQRELEARRSLLSRVCAPCDSP
jgi:hypothetical protein